MVCERHVGIVRMAFGLRRSGEEARFTWVRRIGVVVNIESIRKVTARTLCLSAIKALNLYAERFI